MSTQPAKLSRLNSTALASNPRATKACWVQMKPFVDAAIAIHPRPYICTTESYVPASLVNRLRDGIRGCLAFAYEDEAYTKKLRDWYSQIIVKPVGVKVYLGPTEKNKLPAIEIGTLSESSTNGLSFHTLSLPEINAFALLLSGGKLSGPVIVRQPPDISSLEERTNLEILTPEDGSLVLL